MAVYNKNNTIEWLMRIGVALTFFGHGYFAYSGNVSWIAYLNTVGFSDVNAMQIMPYIGILDFIVALIILVKPFRIVLLWAVVWAFSTALIRPLSGEPIFTFIERGANWALPLALYLYLRLKK